MDCTGDADRAHLHGLLGNAGLFQQSVMHAHDLVDNALSAARIRTLYDLAGDCASKIGQCGMDLGATDIDTEDEGLARLELIGHRASPDRALSSAGYAQPALILKIAHNLDMLCFDSPVRRASSARDTGAFSKTARSTVRDVICRVRGTDVEISVMA